MTPQVESQYDNVTIKNILGEDFYWQMGYDSNNEPVEFMLPADSEISLQRYPARHAIKKMIQQAIQKFEWHEVEKKNGEMKKQYGGILQLDPSLKKKYEEMIVVGVSSIAVKKDKTFGETVREQVQAALGRTGSDDAFANLNQSNGDEVSKMSYSKLKKVATALGINPTEKGMTQDKLRDEVRKAMASSDEE